MIKELLLKSFGRFRDTSFDFSPVTVFIGENESGKSTIFDAIFDNISEPRRNTLRGRRLAERYGEERESVLVFDGSAIRIDQDEFLNLHAIGAGDIVLDLASGGDWLERVKSSIFTGGIDPGMLAGEFEKLASDNGTMAHMKKLRRKETEKKEVQSALDSLVERKTRIISGEQAIKGRRGELDKLMAVAERLNLAIREKEHLLAQQGKIRDREGLVRTMELIGRHAALGADLRRLERYGRDRTGQLKSLEKNISELRANKTRLESEAASLARQAESLARKTADRARQVESLKARAFVASRLSATIDAAAPRPVIRVVTAWNRIILASSALPLAAGAAAFALVQQKHLAAAALIGGAVIALIMVFFARKTHEHEEKPDPADLINRVRDEWRAATKEDLSATTLEVLRRELLAAQSIHDAAERELSGLREEELSIRNESGEAGKRAASAGEGLAAAVTALDGELRELGVRDIGEYGARRGEYESARANLTRVAAELDAEIRRFGAEGVEGLRAECELRAAVLRNEITAEKLPDPEINRLQRELASLKLDLKNHAEKEAALRSSIDKGEGEVRGSLGDLPELIHEKETALRQLEDEISGLQLDRKAAEFARDIFCAMAKDSGAVFAELGGDISRFMDGILPAGRHVELRDFDNGAVEISDAGGELRRLADLSTGTRDSFCLAARLALALRSWDAEGEGIIVLDEPFHSLDESRIARALGLLKKFHDDHGWQIVLLSKERGIAGTVKDLVPGARVHLLQGGQPAIK